MLQKSCCSAAKMKSTKNFLMIISRKFIPKYTRYTIHANIINFTSRAEFKSETLVKIIMPPYGMIEKLLI